MLLKMQFQTRTLVGLSIGLTTLENLQYQFNIYIAYYPEIPLLMRMWYLLMAENLKLEGRTKKSININCHHGVEIILTFLRQTLHVCSRLILYNNILRTCFHLKDIEQSTYNITWPQHNIQCLT